MSSENYRIEKQDGVYFLTFTVTDWVDVFTRLNYRNKYRKFKNSIMKSLNIKAGLNLNKSERIKHLEHLNVLLKDKTKFASFQFLYENLNIIDSKSTALLTFNSLIIAVLAIWTANNKLGIFLYVYTVILLMFLLSSLLCMLTVFLHWSSTSNFENHDIHTEYLLQVREKRTIKFRCAWYLSYLGILLIFVAKVTEVFIVK